jgi:hypothetical protein
VISSARGWQLVEVTPVDRAVTQGRDPDRRGRPRPRQRRRRAHEGVVARTADPARRAFRAVLGEYVASPPARSMSTVAASASTARSATRDLWWSPCDVRDRSALWPTTRGRWSPAESARASHASEPVADHFGSRRRRHQRRRRHRHQPHPRRHPRLQSIGMTHRHGHQDENGADDCRAR